MPAPPPYDLAFCVFKYFPHGGLQRDFVQIVQACVERGHHVTIYCATWTGPKLPNVKTELVPVSDWSNHGKMTQFGQKTQSIISNRNHRAVIGFNKIPGLDLYYAADSCYQMRGRTQRAWWYRLLPRYRTYCQLEKAVFSPEASTIILLLSPLQQQEFEQCYHTPSQRLWMLPPNVSSDRKRPDNARDVRTIIRKQLGVTSNQYLLIQVGSSFKTKGLDRSLEAIASLPPDRQTQIVFAIAGVDKTPSWEHRVATQQILAKVHFLGPRDDVMSLMVAADLMLHPSRHESAGIVLLEAQIAGLPCITTATCGYAFHIEQAQSGWVLPNPFQQTIFNQCLQAALNTEELSIKQNNALNYAAKTDFTQMVHSVVTTIETVAAQKPREKH